MPKIDKELASYTPFTKTSPNYPHKNNADNSIKIAFTNSDMGGGGGKGEGGRGDL